MSSLVPNEGEFSFLLSDRPEGFQPDCDLPAESIPDDEELIRRLRVGEAASFAIFFDRYACSLFAMTWCILRDLRDAENALENAFVWMWNHPLALDSKKGRSFYAFALLAARSAALDLLLRRSTDDPPTPCSRDEMPASEFEAGPWTGNTMIQQGERMRVDAALYLLSQPQRKALELAFFAAMTDQEISSAYGTPLVDVEARIRDGLTILREHLS